MLHTLLMIVHIVSATCIVALVLVQRGKGADAGAGFGAGASGTVFGARGSANFLSSATKWLATAFFILTLFMAWRAAHIARDPDAGVGPSIMSDVPADATLPASPAPLAPAAPAPAATAPVIAPATTTPAQAAPAQTAPAQPASPPPATVTPPAATAPAPAPQDGSGG